MRKFNRFRVLACGLMLLAALTTARATPPIPTDSPLSFFTNVAARVLSTELNLNLNQIQVYPTNQYTPAVNRLLQVTANIYDATTGNYFPTVFRPLFSSDGAGNVFITGYTNVPSVTGTSDWQLSPPLNVTVLAALPGPFSNLATNVYGVPWILGVKPGFPTFNEFVEEDIVGITRRLQVTRDTNYEAANFPKIRLTGTNQMYIFSVNSSVGVDFWNSYSSNFNDNVTVFCQGYSYLTITNDDPGFDGNPTSVMQPLSFAFGNIVNIGPAYPSASYWPGTSPWHRPQPLSDGQPNLYSFDVPVYFNDYPVLTNSVYRTSYASMTPGALPPGFAGPCLIPTNYFAAVGMAVLFETNTPGFPLPHFGLVSTNFLQVFILDQDASSNLHVIDYAHLLMSGSQDLNAEILTDDINGIWNSNIDAATGVPYGIQNQIAISRALTVPSGTPPTEDGVWQSDQGAMLYGTFPTAQQAYFRAFFLPYGTYATVPGWGGYPQGGPVQNFLPIMTAPYAPTRYAVGYTILQANDPLIHSMVNDLTLSLPSTLLDLPPSYNNSISNILPLTSLNLGRLNYNYQPWGGNPTWNNPLQNTNAINVAERDPLLSQSDFWNFSTNQTLNAGWLGQIHRGTPWQTIYLKSPDILAAPAGTNWWMRWTGDFDPKDASAMAPRQDWRLAGLLAAMFDTNDFRTLFSVNNPSPAAWESLMDGLVAETNTASGEIDTILISSNSPQAAIIAEAIETARAGNANGLFQDAGDILAVPALSGSSPYLNPSLANGASDAAWEAIPSQLLPLIRSDSIGLVAPGNGQPLFQFTGYDGHDYLIQASANLLDWSNLITNSPVGGVLNFTNPPSSRPGARFYRSLLLN